MLLIFAYNQCLDLKGLFQVVLKDNVYISYFN